MSSTWGANDWCILLAGVAGLVGSCFAGARLSNCVKISVCSDQGWLYIERRLTAATGSPSITVSRTNSNPDLEAAVLSV